MNIKAILHRITLSLALSIALVASASLCEAATISVPSLGYSTIQSAIDNASDDDIVLVDDGIYSKIDFIGKKITVKSVNGANTTTIDGNASASVVVFENSEVASSVLNGFTITNGLAANGGGVYCNNSSPTIIGCVINNNISSYGGGIYSASPSSSPTIINCTISNNSATNDGGGIWFSPDSIPTLVNCIVWGNTGNNEINAPDATVTHSDIKWNPDPYLGDNNINTNPLFVGGGDYHLKVTSPCIDTGTDDKVAYPNLPTIDMDAEPRHNWGGYDMGADEYICTDADSDTYAIDGGMCGPIDCDDNDPDRYPGNPEVCDRLDNDCNGLKDDGLGLTCDEDGDGLPNEWELAYDLDPLDSTGDNGPSGNPDRDGYTNLQEYERGCDPNFTSITINVPDNYTNIQSAIDASACGDTILVAPGTYIENINFSGQVVTLTASGPDTIIDGGGADSVVRFESGEKEYTVLSGFVIRNGGNTAFGYGGGIDIFESSPTITNNLIINNDADAGGGIACDGSSPIIINNTIVDNTAFDGAGIYCLNTNSPYVANTILWDNNGAEIDLDNASITVEYSDIEGGYTGTGNINADPLFLDAAGADYHLQAGSPCIDSGIYTSAVLNDIDGNARPQGAAYDIGAYEYVATEDTVTAEDAAGEVAGEHQEGADGSGCFIATAAYGTPMAHEVRILCRFRDTYLLSNSPGQKFVSLYYKYSPPVADYIRHNPYLKAAVRGMLKPLVWLTEKILSD